MWIGIICIILLIIGVWANSQSWATRNDYDESILVFNWVVGICGGLSLIVAVIAYPTSFNTLAEMKAFHDKTQVVYKQMAAKNKQAVTVRAVQGSATYKTIPALHLKKIEWFNDLYYYYEMWQDNWFVSDYIGRMPKHFKPITEYHYQP